jgi:8-oxo-dGTP diphosphatase
MSANAPASRVEVVAAVIQRAGGEFLLAQRPQDKVYSGYWEFPGGKVEPGEAAADALARELLEELGIEVERAHPWIVREYAYEHAHVRLNFFRVTGWRNEPVAKEAQALSWQHLSDLNVSPMLPANGPVLRSLALPPVLAISDVEQRGEALFLAQLDAALARGLRMVMVREKQMPRSRLSQLTRTIQTHCAPWGAQVLVNGNLQVAQEVSAAGLHLPSAQLMQLDHRPAMEWCSASCHDERELQQAAALGLDFVLLGPVQRTPSHPNTPALGWERFQRLIAGYPLPVYALGGLSLDSLQRAYTAHAHGVAMVRGAWRGSQSFPSDWSG